MNLFPFLLESENESFYQWFLNYVIKVKCRTKKVKLVLEFLAKISPQFPDSIFFILSNSNAFSTSKKYNRNEPLPIPQLMETRLFVSFWNRFLWWIWILCHPNIIYHNLRQNHILMATKLACSVCISLFVFLHNRRFCIICWCK